MCYLWGWLHNKCLSGSMWSAGVIHLAAYCCVEYSAWMRLWMITNYILSPIKMANEPNDMLKVQQHVKKETWQENRGGKMINSVLEWSSPPTRSDREIAILVSRSMHWNVKKRQSQMDSIYIPAFILFFVFNDLKLIKDRNALTQEHKSDTEITRFLLEMLLWFQFYLSCKTSKDQLTTTFRNAAHAKSERVKHLLPSAAYTRWYSGSGINRRDWNHPFDHNLKYWYKFYVTPYRSHQKEL